MHTSFKNNIYCSLDYTGQEKYIYIYIHIYISKGCHIAQPKYNNQIALSPINVKGQGIKLKDYVCNKKVRCWFLITIHCIK